MNSHFLSVNKVLSEHRHAYLFASVGAKIQHMYYPALQKTFIDFDWAPSSPKN